MRVFAEPVEPDDVFSLAGEMEQDEKNGEWDEGYRSQFKVAKIIAWACIFCALERHGSILSSFDGA